MSRIVRRLLCSALALAVGTSAAQPARPSPSRYAAAAEPMPASRAAPGDYAPAIVMAPAGATDQSIARGAIAYVFFCAECHGANGQGHPGKGIPQLAGLEVAALSRQLAALSAGAPNQHARVLAHIDHRDLSAIADYLASLAPPPAIATQ